MAETELYTDQFNIESVSIEEESAGFRTGGHFRAFGLDLVVPVSAVGTVTEFDFSWPIPISIMAAEIDVAAEWIGDAFDVIIAPDTVIGTTSQIVAAGAFVIPVSDTVIGALSNDPENEEVGLRYHIGYLIDVGGFDCGQLIAVDPDAKTITVETAPDSQVGGGSLVKLSVCLAKNCKFTAPIQKAVGESKIGGSYLPAGTVFRIKYQNNDGAAKTVSITLEGLY